MKRWEEQGWQKEDLDKLELTFLKNIFDCKSAESVSAACAYAKCLNKIGANSDNYPVFLKMIEMPNHWVVDSLVGKDDPATFFRKIQPNYFILKECFRSLARYSAGKLSPKAMLLYLGILIITYDSPREGYAVYPITITDINHLGKNLDKNKDQMDPVNKSILLILDRIAALFDPGVPNEKDEIIKVAMQANNIRGKFLDASKLLTEAIPDELFKISSAEKEIAPLRA